MTSVLGQAGPIPILAVTDFDRAGSFYSSIGCRLKADMGMVQMWTDGAGDFLLSKADAPSAALHTVMGWFVPDIDAAVAALRAVGVAFDTYGFPAEGDIVSLGPARLAWFSDPDGNILSLTQA